MSDLVSRIPKGFTSGPWWISGKGVIRSGKHTWVAKIHWENKEANAHLIALAPELAEEVRRLTEENARLQEQVRVLQL